LGRKPNELPDNGMGSVYTTVVYGAWKLLLACTYAQSLPSGVYEAEVKFGMEKLGVVCVPSSLGGADQQHSFDDIKKYLSSLPVMKAAMVGMPFWLYIAIEDAVVGAVLTQVTESKEHIITYLKRC
jgi:hypothetical protein